MRKQNRIVPREIKRLDDTCAAQISELKKEHKRFENRVSRIFSNKINEAKTEAKEKKKKLRKNIKILKETMIREQMLCVQRILRLKKLLNDLNTQHNESFERGYK